ncbi:unnamed protein product [marine sediment metagenome]|uniref:Uncharacterized protein n=1 Tax=marine sediment metagenome TaxID=412755 RepID=X0S2X7_9ZZZZ
MSEKAKRKIWPPIVVGLIVLALVLCLVAIPSVQKYRAYETPNGVPRLRKNIGKRVQIPKRSYVVLGKKQTRGPDTGVLTHVGYRFNNESGFFDCEVHIEEEREEDRSVCTGLSPEQVQQVIVIDAPPVK